MASMVVLGVVMGGALSVLLWLVFPPVPSLAEIDAMLAGDASRPSFRAETERMLDLVASRPGRMGRLVTSDLAVAGWSRRELVGQIGAGLLIGTAGPLIACLVATLVMGWSASPGVAVALVATGAILGVALPCNNLVRASERRRTHFRSVLSSFVDLVVLGLSGGVGLEGSMLAAASISDDWAAIAIATTLAAAREGGQSPWEALGHLGLSFGVDELIELAATLQLAGLEGAKVRQSLAARAEALRRHEQAAQEAAANAATERLFLPGSLLLLGFLIFIGFPACMRIFNGL